MACIHFGPLVGLLCPRGRAYVKDVSTNRTTPALVKETSSYRKGTCLVQWKFRATYTVGARHAALYGRSNWGQLFCLSNVTCVSSTLLRIVVTWPHTCISRWLHVGYRDNKRRSVYLYSDVVATSISECIAARIESSVIKWSFFLYLYNCYNYAPHPHIDEMLTWRMLYKCSPPNGPTGAMSTSTVMLSCLRCTTTVQCTCHRQLG